MFTDVTTQNCEVGVNLRSTSAGPVQIIDSSLDASQFAIKTDEKTTSKLMLTSTTIERGNVYIKGGTLLASDCDFNNPSPQVFFGSAGTGTLSGNRAKNQMCIRDRPRIISRSAMRRGISFTSPLRSSISFRNTSARARRETFTCTSSAAPNGRKRAPA